MDQALCHPEFRNELYPHMLSRIAEALVCIYLNISVLYNIAITTLHRRHRNRPLSGAICYCHYQQPKTDELIGSSVFGCW